MEDDDDKKPFDAEGLPEEDSQPDPDEQLMLDQGNGRVWLVKIPKCLMERWCAIDAEDVHLATIRVYANATGAGKKPRIVLFLPPNRDPAVTPTPTPTPPNAGRPVFASSTTYQGSEPDSYELDMVNDTVENQIVVAERPKDSSLSVASSAAAATVNTRARTTILTGRIKHDCNLRPVFTESYRKQMKERSLKYNTHSRQIRMIEDAGVSGGKGGINRLSSGVGVGAGNAFSSLVKPKPKPAKGTFERMARMPRNQLLDLIFQLFRDTQRWSIKTLRERTQQPEVYLKEVLSEVAYVNRTGEFTGMWELKENFKEGGGSRAEGSGGLMGIVMDDVKMENGGDGGDGFEDDDDDDDEDDDDDMEEVS